MNMVPKKIHYCWFGGNPLPQSAKKCINSWKKFFPEFDIIEWNESNYDVKKSPYIRDAYNAKKYAYVSDYARYDILYQQGGLYFDTDVEVIKDFSEIISHGPFMGFEVDPYENGNYRIGPGLGLGAEPNMIVYEVILEKYSKQNFYLEENVINPEAVVAITTDILTKFGLDNRKGIQEVAGITIYPKEYFNPLNNNTGKLDITENTHSIHWYDMSWMSKSEQRKSKVTRIAHRVFGEDCFKRFKT